MCGGDGRLLGAVIEELLTWTLLQPLPTPSNHILGYVWQMGCRLKGYREKDRGGQTQSEMMVCYCCRVLRLRKQIFISQLAFLF